jgi:hypothetical protein
MKALLFLIVLVGLILGAAYLVYLAPYHIYTMTLTEGVDTKFLKMESSLPEMMDGNFFKDDIENRIDTDNDLFKILHFSNFLLPLPIKNPLYIMIPVIKTEQQHLKLGATFYNPDNKEIFSFMAERVFPFELTSGRQKLFLLPYLKNYIDNKSNDEVWRDIFSKKLSLPANTGKTFFESIEELKKISYLDLVYNLYILYNRHLLFSKNIVKLSFDLKTSRGIIEYKSENKHERDEQIFFLNEGLIYSIRFKSKSLSRDSLSYRALLLKEIKFKQTFQDSAIPIYAQYKNISYQDRVDQKGMVYLYTAWSHDLENPGFTRVIISFLERGNKNFKFLQPFYDYAFKKFGTNLSGDKDSLVENADAKLKRKISEDLYEESKNSGNKAGTIEGNFTDMDEKVKYYLDKAKAKPKDTDEKNGVLSIE